MTLDLRLVEAAGGELIDALDPIQLAMLPTNDAGNATRFAKRMGDRFRHVRNVGWFAFTGTHWSLERGESLASLAAREISELIHDEADALELSGGSSPAVKSLRRLATRSGNARSISGMLQLAQHLLPAELADFDRDPLALNCLNGTVRLVHDEKEGWLPQLHPHSPRDMISRITKVRYEPAATSLRWTEHLARMQPDEEMRDYVQRIFGYTLTGHITEQAFFVLQGRGGDGKSTTVNTIRRVLGGYAATADVRTFLAPRDAASGGGDRATPALARLAGDVRLVATSEPPKGSHLNEGLIKAATGGAPLAVRHLSMGMFEYTPRWKLILECNALPFIPGDDEGIWRRAKLVPWRVQLHRSQMDPGLENKLVEEGEGVLNWLIQGACAYLERGLAEPEAAQEAIGDFRRGSNAFGEWLTECVTIDAGSSETQKALYASFRAFCEERGDDVIGNRAFGRALSNQQLTTKDGPRGRTSDKARDQLRFGARLKSNAEMVSGLGSERSNSNLGRPSAASSIDLETV